MQLQNCKNSKEYTFFLKSKITEQQNFETIGRFAKKGMIAMNSQNFLIRTASPAICSNLTVLFNRIIEEEFYRKI